VIEKDTIIKYNRFIFGRVVDIITQPHLPKLLVVKLLAPPQHYGKLVRCRINQVTEAPLLYQLAGALGDDE
jgi:hypothetical protein